VRELSLAVVGLGYWGPNLARNVAELPGVRLAWCCDSDPGALERVAPLPGSARLTGSLEQVLADQELDGVLLATPVRTHAELAIRVLEAGKHCFVEKPLAQSVADAERVLEAARANGRLLMVGHLLEYHPGVRALADLIDAGELGTIHYIYTNRLNLGLLRADENALWSLGAHDVSVILSLAGEEPVELDARGECYMRPGVEDVVFAFMRFESGLAAHMHLSWLDPHKERRLTVVGSRRMATFDDMEPQRKLTIYDKGFDQSAERWGEYIARSGPSTSPPIDGREPLALEVEHFAASIREGTTPRSDGESGLRVVRVLEALQAQLERTRR
jgi:predicted dehydrogenase